MHRLLFSSRFIHTAEWATQLRDSWRDGVGWPTEGMSFMFRILVAASLAFLPLARMSGQTSSTPAKLFTLAQVWTLNETYNDLQHGVSFRYPSIWKPSVQFSYIPPALTQSAVAKPIAGFSYSEGGFPRTQLVGPYAGTNLEGIGLVYSAIPAASLTDCKAKAVSVSNTPGDTPVSLGGRFFSVYKTEGAGMSQSTSGKLYATYAGSTCYLFETDVAMVAPGVADNIETLTPTQLQFIDTHLLAIMESVRIIGR
jgi:hypothetical protein